ncbi:type II toxin-antitoxin system VapC family toxin [bacterium]|nr:type II toxin-antitoxin system VapC family toxin [bacterium]
MFVDSSVLVAILSDEEDAAAWAERIEGEGNCVTSPLVVLESTMRLSSKLSVEPAAVGAVVAGFLADAAVTVVAIEPADSSVAIDAFQRYGKGRGHNAQLNLADCLSYACARRLGIGLLYKGGDFSRTDLA